jgi:lysophospholipase L1-like esterase
MGESRLVAGRVRRRSSGLLLAGVVLATACSREPDVVDTPSPSASVVASTPRATALPTGTPQARSGGAYLALGDSITFGIGVPRPQRNGYVARVADRLAGVDPPITETRVFAVPGETATGFLERRLDDVVRAVEDLGPRVELVTIGLGANELLRTRRAPACAADRESAACAAVAERAITEAAESLDAIVASVRGSLDANGSDAPILLLAYYNPDATALVATTVAGSDGRVGCDPSEARPGLDDRIACVAERRRAGLVDLYAAFLGREAALTRISVGDVHPNADGYQVIADAIIEVLAGAP